MPLKTSKQDAADLLTLEWVLQVKAYRLTLDRRRCVGCQVCTLACPKEAVATTEVPPVDGKAQHRRVDIDLKKCNFCAICDLTCPFGAIKVTQNGVHTPAVLAKDSYPQLTREIEADTTKCPPECTKCEETCPLHIIKVTKTTDDPAKTQVAIQKEACPTCTVCAHECPVSTIHVKKTFEGALSVDADKCPEGCHKCVDVCPIPGTLTLGEDGKVQADPATCVFCGACLNVCPQPEALHVHRSRIHHAAIHSGAWNKTLERLTSCADAAKEFRTQACENRKLAIAKRLQLEGRNNDHT
jgi:4Fe-4S ferredoxin